MEKCQANNTLDMSKICLNTTINSVEDCFPEDYLDNGGIGFATIAGILCVINAIIGTLGNLLTLVALPFATKKKKYLIKNLYNI